MGFSHSSKTAEREPSWGTVNKGQLPRLAYANMGDLKSKSSWGFPHHWVQNGGNLAENGTFTTGTLYLHKGGLNAAYAAAQGARSGQEASSAIKAHLNGHRRALGLIAESADEGKGEEAIILQEGADAGSMLPFGDKMQVDREAGIVRNVPILGIKSPTRKREYTLEALRAAVPLFEGIPYYGDRGIHEKWDARPSPFDLIGVIENAHLVEAEQKIRADIKPHKQMAEWFLGIAEDMPNAVGCSPIMRGIQTFKDGKSIVVRILEAQRVDLVSQPSTVRGLSESASVEGDQSEEEIMDLTKLTEAELRKERPDLIAIFESAGADEKDADQKIKKLTEQTASLKKQLDEGKKKVDDLEAEKVLQGKKVMAAKLLAESGLPKDAISDEFRKLVEGAKDEDGMKKLVEDRQKLVESVRKSPTSYERVPIAESAGDGTGKEEKVDIKDDAQMVDAVQGVE